MSWYSVSANTVTRHRREMLVSNRSFKKVVFPTDLGNRGYLEVSCCENGMAIKLFCNKAANV